MPKSSKKKSKSKRPSNNAEPATQYSRSSNTADDDDDDDSSMPALEPAGPPQPTTDAGAKTHSSSRTGLSPELESVHFSTTASLHAMATPPELGKTAQDLYRSLDKDALSIPEDSDYWLSLPPTIKSFVQNAYAHGMFPVPGGAGGDVERDRMYTAAQQMIANGVQPPGATKRNGGGTVATPPYPPGAYPSYPPFDPSMFSDPAFTQALEQLMPRSGTQGASTNPVLQNDFGGASGGDEFSEDDEDEVELDVNNVVNGSARKTTTASSMANYASAPGPPPASKVPAPPESDFKKQPKKPAKSTVPVPPTPSLPPPPNPVPNPPLQQQPKQAPIQSVKPQAPALAPPSRPAPTPTSVPPPSSRAAGKQPMSYPPTPNSAAVPPPRSAKANGKAPATSPNHYHHHPSPPASTGAAAPTKPRPPANGAAATTASAPAATPPPAPGTVTPGQPPGGKKKENKIWSSSTTEDRERIKDFWLGLPEKERRKLVELEKDAVLKKMKEQQRHSCGCAVCGRKRSAIEDELEVLYDAYYDELESYANQQQQYVNSPNTVPPPLGPGPFPGSVEFDQNGAVIPNDLTKHPAPPVPPMPEDEYDDDDEDYDDVGSEEGSEEEDEDDDQEPMPATYPKSTARRTAKAAARTQTAAMTGKRNADAAQQDFFTFGPGLTVAGNILTVADDLLKNDGTKFLEMMEQLADRRSFREEMAAGAMMDDEDSEEDEDGSDEDSGSEDDDEEEDEDEDNLTEEHKMEEGRRMFSIFAARMFEQRVLVAYREKVAQDRQLQLIKELEEEDRAAAERDAKKTRDNQKKKDKKKQQKQAKEEETARKAREKAEQEAASKARKAALEEENRKRRDEERIKREAERKAKEEEKMAKELERRKRAAEEKEKERKDEAERKKKERDEKEKENARLRKEREERERVEKERLKKVEVERLAAEAERLKEEAAKRAKEEKERQEREAAALKQATEEKAAAAAAAKVAAAAAPPPPPVQLPRNVARANGSSQGKKSQPKLSNVAGPSSSSSSPSVPMPVAPPVIARPSPTPSAIPLQSSQQRLGAPSPGLSMGPIGRRATAPTLNASPQGGSQQSGPSSGGMLPQMPFPGMYGPPSPASMSFGGPLQFGMQLPQQQQQQQRPPPPLQPSPLPQFGDPMGFHAVPPPQQPPQTPFPSGPPPPIGSRRNGNGSPGPNAMMSPGSIAPPGAIGSGFSPGPVTTAHSRRSSLDPIGSRTFGAITRPIAPIGTRPSTSSAAPGTPLMVNGAGSSKLLDGDDGPLKGSPVRRAESPERLGSSALVDPTDEPLPSNTGRRGPYWPTTTDLGKAPDPRFGGTSQWSAFPLPGSGHPLPPPPGSSWGVSPSSMIGPGGNWPSVPPGRGSFSPIGTGSSPFINGGFGAGAFPGMPPFGAVGGPTSSGGGGSSPGGAGSSSG